LAEAIRRTDVARISLVPGIGKKTALRIAMELQDKLEKKERVLAARGSEHREDLISTLMNMGFRRKEVERVVDLTVTAHPPKEAFEKLLRDCLQSLATV
jgi:Holliday junction DNA helicase RuvA